MHQYPLLTIAVPTYNRARYLAFLLATLERELREFEDQVLILVSDNASTDDTPSVIASFSSRISSFRSRSNKFNDGPDSNVSACYLLADTPYVWILGDDDAPLNGMLRLLLNLLRRESPDMVYLPSLSTTNIMRDQSAYTVDKLAAVQLSRDHFASVLHVQMTFISGLVVRKRRELDVRVREQFAITQGSCLMQMAWVLENLKHGERFLVCKGYPIMATAANSGSYAVFEVFMVNHTRIVSAILANQPETCRRILGKTSLCFLPGLVWHVRRGSMGDFKMQARSDIKLPEELTHTRGFRWLVRPIWSLPKVPATVAFFCSRVVTFIVRQYQRFVLFPSSRQIEVIE